MNRLDFDFAHEGGVFPGTSSRTTIRAIARWLEAVLHMVPVAPAARRLQPAGRKNLDPAWIRRLGQTGKDCYDAILRRDAAGPGRLDERVHGLLGGDPARTVRHPTVTVDLWACWSYYQAKYPGAMYSGCGGGYLYVVSEQPVPGSFRVAVRFQGPVRE